MRVRKSRASPRERGFIVCQREGVLKKQAAQVTPLLAISSSMGAAQPCLRIGVQIRRFAAQIRAHHVR